jgi:hypothetical protein
MREQELQIFAQESAKKSYSDDQCYIAVQSLGIDVALAGNLKNRKSIDTLVSEFRLAGHPDVRDQIARLLKIRDEAWAMEANFLRGSPLHGPYQTLVDLMYRQRDPDERRHAASTKAYLKYLHKRFAL